VTQGFEGFLDLCENVFLLQYSGAVLPGRVFLHQVIMLLVPRFPFKITFAVVLFVLHIIYYLAPNVSTICGRNLGIILKIRTHYEGDLGMVSVCPNRRQQVYYIEKPYGLQITQKVSASTSINHSSP
jgi:hypothetical protein